MVLAKLVCLLALAANLANCENPKKDSSELLNHRLPNETYPVQYDITLNTDIHEGRTSFKGKVVIDIVVATTTKNIVLHGAELEVSNDTTAYPHGGEPEELSVKYVSETDLLILTRKNLEEFNAETRWKLTISYKGEFQDGKIFFFKNYNDGEGKDHYLLATRFHPKSARYAFPCYDEPGKLAYFTLTINHSPVYRAISNMPVDDENSSYGKTVFSTTPRISSHLLKFVVFDFEYNERTLNGTRYRVYSRPGTQYEFEWIFSFSNSMIDYMSEYTGIKFMNTKLDFAVLPQLEEIRKSFGLIISDEDLLRKDYDAIHFTDMIPQEWFFQYVTNQWWDSYWIKLAFSRLFSFKAQESIHPEEDIWSLLYRWSYFQKMRNDPYPESTPLNIYQQDDDHLTVKGSLILHMWNNALTEKVFQKATQNFLINNLYSPITEDELFRALQNAVEEENYELPAAIGKMMGTWIFQAGYPLLTVTRNYEKGTFNIRQEVYYLNETIKDNKTWYVPFNFAVASDSSFNDTKATHFLLNLPEMEVQDVKVDKEDWLILNKQSTGYYRIKYDDRNYNLIINSLIENPFAIHYLNRAQLIFDTYYLNPAMFVRMLTYLKKEDHFAPWFVVSEVSEMSKYFVGDVKYFNLFFAELVSPILNKLGFNDIPGERHMQKLTRSVILKIACNADIEECLVESNNKLKNLIRKNASIPLNNFLCQGLKESGEEEFNFFYQKLMDPAEKYPKKDLISKLGCIRNTLSIVKLFKSSIDENNNLSYNDRLEILSSFCSQKNLVGLSTCIEILNNNFKAFGNLKEPSGKGNLLNKGIMIIATLVLNKEQQEKFTALVDKVKNSEYAMRDLEMRMERKKSFMNNVFKEYGTLERITEIMLSIKMLKTES